MDVDDDVRRFIDAVTPERRRRDAETLLALMHRATGQPPRLEGTAIGFGRYDYRYESGREGDAAAAGFAPRKAATSVYLMDGVSAHATDLARLGPHTSGVGCVYLKSLDDVDLDVLEQIVARSYRTLTSGTYGLRARDGKE
jgi:Domain of unknown function (DU1801)